MTVRKIADKVGVSVGSVDSILNEDLSIHRVAAQFFPKELSLEQRQHHVKISEDMLQCSNKGRGFLKTMVIGDEMWVYGYNLETKVQ